MKKSRRNSFIKAINRINLTAIFSIFYIIFSISFFIFEISNKNVLTQDDEITKENDTEVIHTVQQKPIVVTQENFIVSTSLVERNFVQSSLNIFKYENIKKEENITESESIANLEKQEEETTVSTENITVKEETTNIETETSLQIEEETTINQIITTPQIITNNGLSIEGLIAKDDLTTVIIIENDMSLDDYIYYLINTYSMNQTRIEMTYDNIYIMAQMCTAESGGQPHNGKIGTCEVLLNRYDHFNHTLTLKELIYSPNQFHVVNNGSINNTPSKQCILAAVQAILGETPVMGSYYFLNPDIATNTWIQNNKVPSIKIGEHQFYYK